MSHFTVMVVTDSDSTKELEATLQPFHEFECTGIKDEYVKFIPPEESDDVLEKTYQEVKDEYNYENREQFLIEYYGYEKNEQAEWGRFTNPNAKWDWWSIGGRWTGTLKLKEQILIEDESYMPNLCGFSVNEIQEIIKQVQKGNDKILNNFVGKRAELRKAIMYYTQKAYQQGKYGDSMGVFHDMGIRDGKIKREEIQLIGYCDTAYKKHIDMEGMNKKLTDKASEEWKDFHSKITKEECKFVINTRKERRKTQNYDLNKEEVNKIINKVSDNDPFKFCGNEFENLANMTKDEYIECAGTWSPYALLYDGKWYSKGDMGWWGVSTNEESQWKGSFIELWKSIPEDSYITMVDCHI